MIERQRNNTSNQERFNSQMEGARSQNNSVATMHNGYGSIAVKHKGGSESGLGFSNLVSTATNKE